MFQEESALHFTAEGTSFCKIPPIFGSNYTSLVNKHNCNENIYCHHTILTKELLHCVKRLAKD